MQGELTPMKGRQDENPCYSAEFTSGKHLRRVKVDVFSANRNEVQIRRRFFPLVNALAEQSASPQQPQNPQSNEQIKQELSELGRKCGSKEQQLRSMQSFNPKSYDSLRAAMDELKELKAENSRKREELLKLTKKNGKTSLKLEKLEQKTKTQKQEARRMVQEQDQSIYYGNRIVFQKEKEKQQLINSVNQLSQKNTEIIIILQEKQRALDAVLVELHQQEENREAITAKMEEITHDLNHHILQVAVLKMQVNHDLRVGFEALNSSQSSKKRILEKDPNLWQKRNKTLLKQEIKYYLIIQLYPCWRRLLERLSYHFVGYKQLLCPDPNSYMDTILEDLDEYIFTKNMKKVANKAKSYIVSYSPRAQAYHKLKEILSQLEGFSNGIIHVRSVRFEKSELEGVEQARIQYNFKEQERVKVVELTQLKELSRETLMPHLPKNNDTSKALLLKIEIPFYFESVADRLKMEEVYRLIERS